MRKYLIIAAVLFVMGCTKEGDTIYLPDPNEEQASNTPLVTVIYGDNSLGDRSYCDMIYEGVERTAQELGLRTMQLSPQSTEEGAAISGTHDATDGSGSRLGKKVVHRHIASL
jgi:basic membrane protein A